MRRHRLRFLLHELDLGPGSTTIGRSVDCDVTLDDPLVSRRHARIDVGAGVATLEDLASRNGVSVNGTPIRGPTELRDADRIRIGENELVYCEVESSSASFPRARDTGQLRVCANCHLPYPREVHSCPRCEATEQVDDDRDTETGKREAIPLAPAPLAAARRS